MKEAIAPQPEWIVSVDDHIIEPEDLWTGRLRAKDCERAPHTEVGDDGLLYWVYESTRRPISRTTFEGGCATKGLGYIAGYDELEPWCYDPSARAEAMTADGVLASLCFPMFPRYCGQTFLEASDRTFALECLRAYNDWMTDTWAASTPGRFIPLVLVPLWDPRLAAEEVERTAAKGAKAIAFSENPAKLGLPSLHDENNYWHPLLAAADDTGLPLCVHFGSSSSMPTTSPDAPLLVTGSLAPANLMFALVDWLFSGKLIDGDRSPYPNLKICFSEGGIGWIPYILERCDLTLRRRPYLQEQDWKADAATGALAAITSQGARRMDVPPSELFRRHMYGCFIDDEFGSRHIHEIGIDNVMLETDFPHGDSSYPDSLANAHRRLGHLDLEDRRKVMIENACRVFDFTPVDSVASAVSVGRGHGTGVPPRRSVCTS